MDSVLITCHSSHWPLQLPLKIDILADHRRHLSQEFWLRCFRPGWLDICRHLLSFVVICRHLSWLVMVKWNAKWTGVHATCVWVLVWDGWGGHPIRCSQDDKCEPESSRRSSGVFCILFISIVFFESGFSMWSVSIYLCLSLGIGVVSWFMGMPLMTIVWWLRALQLSVRLSNNLPAVGQIHKPSLVLNLGSIFVLCFDQIEYWIEAVAQCSCMLNLSVYTLFVRYLWGFIQFRKNLLWLEFSSWWTNCCLRHYDEGAFAINVEEAKQHICLEWLVVHSLFFLNFPWRVFGVYCGA